MRALLVILLAGVLGCGPIPAAEAPLAHQRGFDVELFVYGGGYRAPYSREDVTGRIVVEFWLEWLDGRRWRENSSRHLMLRFCYEALFYTPTATQYDAEECSWMLYEEQVRRFPTDKTPPETQ